MKYLTIIIILFISHSSCSVYNRNKSCQDNIMKTKYLKARLLDAIEGDLNKMNSKCNEFKKIISIECVDNKELEVKIKTNCKDIFYIYHFNDDFKIINKITEMSSVSSSLVEG